MANKTSIEWADLTSNPLRAVNTQTGKDGTFCVHCSPGCAKCYAGRMNRWRGNGLDFIAQNAGKVEFRLNERELASWRRLKPGVRVFPFDMCDLFYEGVPEALIDRCFAAMALSPATFLVLTKRAKRLHEYLTSPDLIPRVDRALLATCSEPGGYRLGKTYPFPLPNVWLGVSAEDQQRADERIPLLLETPAAVRFVSYEPALGPVDWEPWVMPRYAADDPRYHRPGGRALDWIIYGGESGPGARPFDLGWARQLLRQAGGCGVAVFVKQLGYRPYYLEDDGEGGSDVPGIEHAATAGLYSPDPKGGDPEYWPADLRVREFPEVA